MRNHALPQHNVHFVLDSIIYRIEFSFPRHCILTVLLLLLFFHSFDSISFSLKSIRYGCLISMLHIFWYLLVHMHQSFGIVWREQIKIRRLTLLVFNTLGNHDIITFGSTYYYIALITSYFLLLPDRVVSHLFSSIDIIRCSLLIICRFKWNIHF